MGAFTIELEDWKLANALSIVCARILIATEK
jgi:hypothetical protein